MKNDRFLLAILLGIGLLSIVAVIRVLTYAPPAMTYGEESTPEGVVHNYLVAIYRGDYERAYSYLADKEKKPSLETFRRAFVLGLINPKEAMAQVGKVTPINDKEARVEINILYSGADPFSPGYSNLQYALLVRQGEAWKIQSMPYPFWDSSWYEIVPPPPTD
jgi:hypothetical protein